MQNSQRVSCSSRYVPPSAIPVFSYYTGNLPSVQRWNDGDGSFWNDGDGSFCSTLQNAEQRCEQGNRGTVFFVPHSSVAELLNQVLTFLGLIGVLVDPTTAGLGDSERAMGYAEPWDDNIDN